MYPSNLISNIKHTYVRYNNTNNKSNMSPWHCIDHPQTSSMTCKQQCNINFERNQNISIIELKKKSIIKNPTSLYKKREKIPLLSQNSLFFGRLFNAMCGCFGRGGMMFSPTLLPFPFPFIFLLFCPFFLVFLFCFVFFLASYAVVPLPPPPQPLRSTSSPSQIHRSPPLIRPPALFRRSQPYYWCFVHKQFFFFLKLDMSLSASPTHQCASLSSSSAAPLSIKPLSASI